MQLSHIIRYPLKSCMGEPLNEAQLDQLGIDHDRRLILSEADGRFITARTEPTLLQLRVRPEGEGWRAEHPALGSFCFATDVAQSDVVEVWGRRISATHLSHADAWFSSLLGRPVKLLWNWNSQDQAEKRYDWGPIFSDGYPLLVCTTASLAAVNHASGGLFEMSRFRPNLVIDNNTPWEEDSWQLLKIGDALLRRQKPCERCVLITRDPVTGSKNTEQEPLRTLAKIHSGSGGEILFGQNFSVERAGRLKLGDRAELL